MKKKLVTVALAGTVAAAVLGLTGCGGGGSDIKQPEEKATSFTYWVPMNANIATRIQNYNEVAMYQQREKDSGIHIEFIHPALGQEAEQFNLMIASRDLPDLVEYNWVNYQGGVQKAIDDGVIIKLNDYIDQYAPNFKKTVSDGSKLSKIYDKGSKTDEGNYFAFPCFNIGSYRTFGGPMIRKDWLDELGLSVPETIDEWTTALKAFKEKKGAAQPLTGTSNYFIGTTDAFNGAFGISKNMYLDGDTVKYGPMQKEYKDYLTLMHQCYQDGLLDQDFSTNKGTAVDANITKGKSGAVVGYLGSAMGRYLKQMQTEDPSYNLVCAPYPVQNKGDKNDFYIFEGDVNGRYLAITETCKDPVTATEWADYFYSEEGYYMVNFGIEGESYNMVDGKPVYTDEILHNKDGLSISEALGLSCRATAQAPGLKQAPEYLEQYYEFPQQVDGFKMWAENVEGVRKNRIPEGLSAAQDESEELSALSTDIYTYVEEMSLKFITGQEPLDNFDQFVDTLTSTFNVARYLEIEQNMYDRYLKR